MAPAKRKNSMDSRSSRSPMEKITVFLILLFLCVVIVAAYSVIRKTAARISSDFYFPFLKGIRTAERSMADSMLVMEDKRTLAKAVLQLRREKFSLLAAKSSLGDLARENARLRQLLRLPERPSFKPVIAQLLYRDDTSSTTVFLLDKGEKAGIRPGEIVVTSVTLNNSGRTIAAVAGRVLEVSNHTSTVASIYDKEFKLSVSFGNATGVMQSLPDAESPMCGITFIPVHAKLRKGEAVFTSALTGNAPAGIPVGRISVIQPRLSGISKDRVYQNAQMRPFADPASLRFAAVYVKVPASAPRGEKKRMQRP